MTVKHLSPDVMFLLVAVCGAMEWLHLLILPSVLPSQGRVSCTGRMMVQAVNQRGRSKRSMPGHMRR